MKAMNLKPGDVITARYVATAATRQPAGHRSGDSVRTGSFVAVKERTVQTVTVVGDTAHLTFKTSSRLDQAVTPSAQVPAETTYEVVRNGEVL